MSADSCFYFSPVVNRHFCLISDKANLDILGLARKQETATVNNIMIIFKHYIIKEIVIHLRKKKKILTFTSYWSAKK